MQRAYAAPAAKIQDMSRALVESSNPHPNSLRCWPSSLRALRALIVCDVLVRPTLRLVAFESSGTLYIGAGTVLLTTQRVPSLSDSPGGCLSSFRPLDVVV